MNKNDKLLDIKGRQVLSGHILASIYVSTVHIGVARFKGFFHEGNSKHKFASPHQYYDFGYYQVLGHMDKEHPDYNEEVYNWYMADSGECPIKIRVKNEIENLI